jgi:TolB-like protein
MVTQEQRAGDIKSESGNSAVCPSLRAPERCVAISYKKLRLLRNDNSYYWLWMKLSASFLFLALCPILIFLDGCGPKPYMRPQADVTKIRRIAVLPLENFTPDAYAAEKVRRIVISELLLCNRDVIEPGEVTRLLRESKIKSLGSVKAEEVRDLGKTLGVDAVMMGAVESFGIGKGVSVTYPEVTINLRLIETFSGNVVWSIRNTSGGADFWTRHLGSEGMSLSEAAGKAVRESIKTLF